MIEDIIAVHIDDDISFELKSVGEIREGDEYTGFRVALSAKEISVKRKTLKIRHFEDLSNGFTPPFTPFKVNYPMR